jgi:hypothetical protein
VTEPSQPAQRPGRADTREVAELKALKTSNPELASAVDMQIELLELQRRIQGRIPLPWIQPDPAWVADQQRNARPVVRFSDIPLNWTDVRLAVRQIADVLLRHEALDHADHGQIVALGREGDVLEPIVERWYAATAGVEAGSVGASRLPDSLPPSLDQVLVLALRPFLARCAEALRQTIDLSAWRYGHCPFCGWEPDFAGITPSAERRLICGRCTAQWSFGSITCPYCSNDDRSRITSFATRDGRYRVYACDVCKRYLKAYDGRNAPRPVMVAVDSVATLPLDAAAMQRGYTG